MKAPAFPKKGKVAYLANLHCRVSLIFDSQSSLELGSLQSRSWAWAWFLLVQAGSHSEQLLCSPNLVSEKRSCLNPVEEVADRNQRFLDYPGNLMLLLWLLVLLHPLHTRHLVPQALERLVARSDL